MRQRIRNSVVPTILVALAIVACDKQVPQVITGTLALGEFPSGNMKLRLYASYPDCEGEYIETQTDKDGSFDFHTESTRGGLSVVTQSIALCVEEDGAWHPLWATITAGGAPSIRMKCQPVESDDPFEEFCDIETDYSDKNA